MSEIISNPIYIMSRNKKPLDNIEKGKLTRKSMINYIQVLKKTPYNYNLQGYSKMSDVDLFIYLFESINLPEIKKIAAKIGIKGAIKMNKVQLLAELTPEKSLKNYKSISRKNILGNQKLINDKMINILNNIDQKIKKFNKLDKQNKNQNIATINFDEIQNDAKVLKKKIKKEN